MKTILSILLFATLVAACKKDNSSPNTSSADYYFVGKLDGADLKFEITASSAAEMVISNGSSINPPDCTYSYGCGIGIGFGEPGSKSIDVTFPLLFSGECGDQETAFPGLFTTGTYGFGEAGGQVSVTYFDGTEAWTSFGGTQTGASFEVTESEVVESPFGNSQKVGGELTCSLFNGVGAEKKLEGVSFVLSFWPWT